MLFNVATTIADMSQITAIDRGEIHFIMQFLKSLCHFDFLANSFTVKQNTCSVQNCYINIICFSYYIILIALHFHNENVQMQFCSSFQIQFYATLERRFVK